MLVHRYFKPKMLPDPEGPLSEALPSASIKAANEAMLVALKLQEERPSNQRNRGHYIKLTRVQQAQIVKYTLSHGNQAAIHRYNKEYTRKLCQHMEVQVCDRT